MKKVTVSALVVAYIGPWGMVVSVAMVSVLSRRVGVSRSDQNELRVPTRRVAATRRRTMLPVIWSDHVSQPSLSYRIKRSISALSG